LRVLSSAKAIPLFEYLLVGIPLTILFAILSVAGCYYWAKYKARNKKWALLGLAAPIGWLILMFLKDKRIPSVEIR
jgi:uncharacterized BrkB/YihY/UPF0761 family membrane protein